MGMRGAEVFCGAQRAPQNTTMAACYTRSTAIAIASYILCTTGAHIFLHKKRAGNCTTISKTARVFIVFIVSKNVDKHGGRLRFSG